MSRDYTSFNRNTRHILREIADRFGLTSESEIAGPQLDEVMAAHFERERELRRIKRGGREFG